MHGPRIGRMLTRFFFYGALFMLLSGAGAATGFLLVFAFACALARLVAGPEARWL